MGRKTVVFVLLVVAVCVRLVLNVTHKGLVRTQRCQRTFHPFCLRTNTRVFFLFLDVNSRLSCLSASFAHTKHFVWSAIMWTKPVATMHCTYSLDIHFRVWDHFRCDFKNFRARFNKLTSSCIFIYDLWYKHMQLSWAPTAYDYQY